MNAANLKSMNARVDQPIEEVHALDADERSAVVFILTDSLDGEDEAAVAAQWAAELRRR